jgi:hypothetical protein
MKMSMMVALMVSGVVLDAGAVGAGGGSGGAGASGTGAAAAGAGEGAAAGKPGGTAGGPGAAGDTSVGETGPGDRLGGPPAGYTSDPSVYRSPASAWPGEVEYPSASPRGAVIVPAPAVVGAPAGVIVAPPSAAGMVRPGRIEMPAEPLMCPGINAADPRKC